MTSDEPCNKACIHLGYANACDSRRMQLECRIDRRFNVSLALEQLAVFTHRCNYQTIIKIGRPVSTTKSLMNAYSTNCEIFRQADSPH